MILCLLEHFLLGLVVASLVGIYLSKGREELLRVLVVGVKSVPGMGRVVSAALKNEASNFIKQTPIGGGKEKGRPPKMRIPETGRWVRKLFEGLSIYISLACLSVYVSPPHPLFS